MKTSIITLFALVVVLAIAGPAVAQDGVLSAYIPFNFNIGDSSLPSGTYTVQTVGNGALLLIRSTETRKAMYSWANTNFTTTNLKVGKLVFNGYGDRYFLSSVAWPFGGPSRDLPPSNVEQQVSKGSAKRKLEVASTK
jgi:hypothetical protein